MCFFNARTQVLQIRQLGARSVMLRIPLPEHDEFALTLSRAWVAFRRHTREEDCEAGFLSRRVERRNKICVLALKILQQYAAIIHR
jgi:hypothetical protein